MATIDSSKNPRSASREVSSGKNGNGARGVPMPFTGENNNGGMNSLLKSPIKNNLQQVPVRNGQSGSAKMQFALKGSSTSVKGIALMGDHANLMIVTPSAFV